MQSPNPLRIPKRRVPVRISQFGHDPIDGHLCLMPADAGNGLNAETVLGLLNSNVRVVPFIVDQGETVRLFTRLNIDWVMVDAQVSNEMVMRNPGREHREEPVEIEFMNGSTIVGMMQITGPKDFRPSDFLNTAHDFYPVRTRVGLLLVNKLRVSEVKLGVMIGNEDANAA